MLSATKNPGTPGKLSPTVTIKMEPAYSEGLTLAKGQGCQRCCNQTASHDLPAPFEVQNDRGDWLPAIGSMQPDGTVLVVPAGAARKVGHDWLFGVRYAMIDEPQCVLYNSASIPALPFQLPVPWPTHHTEDDTGRREYWHTQPLNLDGARGEVKLESHVWHHVRDTYNTQWVARPDLGPQIGNSSAQPESQSM